MNLPPVLFVILQTGAAANGGIASITQVMQRLRGHRPIVVTNLESAHSREWQRLGIETHIVPEEASQGLRRSPIGTLATYVRYHRALKKLIASSGALLVHANDPLAFQLAVSAVRRSQGAKIVMNLRDTIDPGRRPPTLRYRMIFAAADHFFYLSEDMAERMSQVAANARRACSVTYSIVDQDRFRPSPLPAGEGAPVVLLSGIVRPKKGQLEFIRHVAPSLIAGGAEVWLAGDLDSDRDPYAAACEEAARPLGEQIRFLGYRSDLPNLLRRCTVVAVPSRHEGLVRAMIEAMSCARPVVSFDVCSAREMLKDKTDGAGIVVPHRDFEGMASAILHFCNNPEAAARAGLAGAEAARRLFDAEQVVERYESAYRALAA